VLATIFLLPTHYLILTEIAILGLFALSLDLILGYAGIISIGHAAFFGVGAYSAGLLANYEIVNGATMAVLGRGVAGRHRGGRSRPWTAAISNNPNSARLAELKRRYDPHNLFQSATALPRLKSILI
jgi:ABC-type branched-subunit amino acid transport system permease subunit